MKVWVLLQTECSPCLIHNYSIKYISLSLNVLKLHIRSHVPVVILVSQQWHLNVPTCVTQSQGADACAKSQSFTMAFLSEACFDVQIQWRASCWEDCEKTVRSTTTGICPGELISSKYLKMYNLPFSPCNLSKLCDNDIKAPCCR